MSEAASAAHAGKETVGSFVTVAAKYFAPFAGVVAGFFGSAMLGGAKSVADMLWNGAGGANGKLPGTSANRIGAAVMTIFWAMVGGVFWSLRSRGGVWMEAIGGFAGGFCFGAAAGNVPLIINGTQAGSGALDNLALWSGSAVGTGGGN